MSVLVKPSDESSTSTSSSPHQSAATVTPEPVQHVVLPSDVEAWRAGQSPPSSIPPSPPATSPVLPPHPPHPQEPLSMPDIPRTGREPPEPAANAPGSRKAKRYTGDPLSATKDSTVCPTCRGGGRNLVVCIDGTSNQFSKKNTNVVELYSRLLKSNDKQLTFYNSGIGTYARPSWLSLSYFKLLISNYLDLAFALRFEKIILSAYAWLADNYVEGDRIFLFGFSRGAYQVRVLSAMIERVGLIHKGNDDQIPFAYELYAADDTTTEGLFSWLLYTLYLLFLPILGIVHWLWNLWELSPEPDTTTDSHPPTRSPSPTSEADARSESDASSQAGNDPMEGIAAMQKRFKDAFARSVKIHFVGVWDTVSSVGLVRSTALPGTVDGMLHVCYFRHALALHERRVKFLPEFVRGGLGPEVNPQDHTIALPSAPVPPANEPALALSVVIDGTGAAALEHEGQGSANAIPSSQSVQQAAKDASEDPPHTKEVWFPGSHSDIGGGASPNEDMRKFGPALRWMSFEARLAGLKITNEPRRWQTKLHKTNSLSLFWTIIEFLPLKRLTYSSISGTTHWPHLWEKRPFHPGQLVYSGVSREAKRLLCDAGLEVERDPYLGAENLLKNLKRHVKSKSLLSETDRASIQVLRDGALGQQQLLDLDHNDDTSETITKYLIDMLIICEAKIDNEPRSVDLVNDIQLLLYGLEYSFSVMRNSQPLHEVLGISLAERQRTFPRPLRRHKAIVTSLGCLCDGTARIVSGAWDDTMIIWDAFTGQPIEAPIGDGSDFNCGSVSTDGKFVVGSFGYPISDGSINVWDLKARKKILGPLIESDAANTIHSVAYSSVGNIIASASSAGITLWNASTGSRVGGSTTQGIRFFSLSFSSDGRFLAGGNSSCVVQIMPMKGDADLMSIPALIGHDEPVRAVAYSPDDTLLVSGSEDGSVRVWSTVAWKALHVMSGHSNGVTCVAFSPKGRYVVSGSEDQSVRIWDAEAGRPVGVPLEGHTGAIRCVAFTPDGTRVVSGSEDETLRIWDRMPNTPLVNRNATRQPTYADLWRRLLRTVPDDGSDGLHIDPRPDVELTAPPASDHFPDQQTSPQVTDQTAHSGAGDGTPEPEQEPHATVDEIPGSEESNTHGDARPQTPHVEAAGSSVHGDGETEDVVADDVADTVEHSVEDVKT